MGHGLFTPLVVVAWLSYTGVTCFIIVCVRYPTLCWVYLVFLYLLILVFVQLVGLSRLVPAKQVEAILGHSVSYAYDLYGGKCEL